MDFFNIWLDAAFGGGLCVVGFLLYYFKNHCLDKLQPYTLKYVLGMATAYGVMLTIEFLLIKTFYDPVNLLFRGHRVRVAFLIFMIPAVYNWLLLDGARSKVRTASLKKTLIIFNSMLIHAGMALLTLYFAGARMGAPWQAVLHDTNLQNLNNMDMKFIGLGILGLLSTLFFLNIVMWYVHCHDKRTRNKTRQNRTPR